MVPGRDAQPDGSDAARDGDVPLPPSDGPLPPPIDVTPPPPIDVTPPPPIDVTPPPPPPIDGGVLCRAPDGRWLRPGETTFDGCNTCVCQPSGALSCTRRFCPDVTPPPPPPPVDGGGLCRAPDGGVLRPGEFWGDRCTSCVCAPDGSGALSCRGIPCVDGGPPPPPPPDAGVCIAPDGRPLRPGETWGDVCTECVCDFGGGLRCTTFCVDGGPPPPPPPPWDAGPACNTISIAGVAPPAVRLASTLPAAVGGAIANGRYELTEAAFVAPPGSPTPMIGRMVMEFTGGVIQLVNETSGFEQRMTYWFMTSGNTFTLVPVCGASSMPLAMRYTATPSQLVLQIDSGPVTGQLTLTRR